jgi:hypothetical protein
MVSSEVPRHERETVIPQAPEVVPSFRKSSQMVAVPTIAFQAASPEAPTMPPKPILCYRAECLETGLVAYGDTSDEARDRLHERRRERNG